MITEIPISDPNKRQFLLAPFAAGTVELLKYEGTKAGTRTGKLVKIVARYIRGTQQVRILFAFPRGGTLNLIPLVTAWPVAANLDFNRAFFPQSKTAAGTPTGLELQMIAPNFSPKIVVPASIEYTDNFGISFFTNDQEAIISVELELEGF